MTRKTLLLAAACMLGLAGAAQADDAFKMVGVWKGEATAVFLGNTPHRTSTKEGPNFANDKLPFEFHIAEQSGQNFFGILKIGKLQETIIGSVDMDNNDGLMVDDDGEWTFEVRSDDHIDLCYHHVTATGRVAGCFPANRVK